LKKNFLQIFDLIEFFITYFVFRGQLISLDNIHMCVIERIIYLEQTDLIDILFNLYVNYTKYYVKKLISYYIKKYVHVSIY